MALNTKSVTLCDFVERFTHLEALVCTDEYASYNSLEHDQVTICHGQREWARDDDGDGWFKSHTNTVEGMWTGLRNSLRPFHGMHKAFLSGYVAIYEFHVNLKAISPIFIALLVRRYSF